MTCKNCGAEVGIEYRLCPYCRSELDYPDRPVIINNYYTQGAPAAPRPPVQQPNINDPAMMQYRNMQLNADRAETEKYATNALIFSILGLVLGLFLLKIIFSIVSFNYVKRAQRNAALYRLPVPGTATAATVICVISLILGAIFFLTIFPACVGAMH